MKARLVLGGMVLTLAAFLAGWSAASRQQAVAAEKTAGELRSVLQKLDDLEARLEQRETGGRETCEWMEALEAGWWEAIGHVQDYLGLRIVNVYSTAPNARMRELLNSGEFRGIDGECIWFKDQPTHMTPERVHGGIQ